MRKRRRATPRAAAPMRRSGYTGCSRVWRSTAPIGSRVVLNYAINYMPTVEWKRGTAIFIPYDRIEPVSTCFRGEHRRGPGPPAEVHSLRGGGQAHARHRHDRRPHPATIYSKRISRILGKGKAVKAVRVLGVALILNSTVSQFIFFLFLSARTLCAAPL